MSQKQVALVNKLMPLYRLGVFHELSKKRENYEFTCFGDTKQQGGIKMIPWELANKVDDGGITWIKTSNYFYISERLLWQSGIIKRILFSDYKYFIFEGAVYHLPTWIFAILCRIRGKKVLFWTHGFKGFDKGLKKKVRIRYFKLAHALLLYGNYSKNIMVRDGFDEKKLKVIFNSLDTTKQFDLLKKSNTVLINKEKDKMFNAPNLFTVIFIGRLVKAKNIQFLLNAVQQFCAEKLPINCIIIGPGPELENIKNFVTNNKLENNIHLCGEVYDEEKICSYFQMSDLMVSPGNVGLNCMHSLAYGIPVLTHDNIQYHGPEVEAIIPGKTGLLFRHNDYSDFIKKINDWRINEVSKIEIRRNCHEILLERYNPVSHAENIIAAIDSL